MRSNKLPQHLHRTVRTVGWQAIGVIGIGLAAYDLATGHHLHAAVEALIVSYLVLSELPVVRRTLVERRRQQLVCKSQAGHVDGGVPHAAGKGAFDGN